MEKRRYIKQEWRKNWKYLQEKLPITTGWITDGVSDDITNKEVTEEIMGLLDKAREEGRKDQQKLDCDLYGTAVATDEQVKEHWKLKDPRELKKELSKLTTK